MNGWFITHGSGDRRDNLRDCNSRHTKTAS